MAKEIIARPLPETPENILRYGFDGAFSPIRIADLYFPDGIKDINEPEFFNEMYEKYILPGYLGRDTKWRDRIFDALEFYSTQPYEVVNPIWEGPMTPFEFREDQFQEFLTTIVGRLRDTR